MTYTDTELHALGFTRQSKTMWRKGDVTYQNGKFYRQGKEITHVTGDVTFLGKRTKAIITLKNGQIIDASKGIYYIEPTGWTEQSLYGQLHDYIGVIADINDRYAPLCAEEGERE